MSYVPKRGLQEDGSDTELSKRVRTSKLSPSEGTVRVGLHDEQDSDNEQDGEESGSEIDEEYEKKMSARKKQGLNRDKESLYVVKQRAQGILLDDELDQPSENKGTTKKMLDEELDDMFANSEDEETSSKNSKETEETEENEYNKHIAEKLNSQKTQQVTDANANTGILKDDAEYQEKLRKFHAELDGTKYSKFAVTGEFLESGRYIEEEDDSSEEESTKNNDTETHLQVKKVKKNSALESKVAAAMSQFDAVPVKIDPYENLHILYTTLEDNETIASLIKRLRPVKGQITPSAELPGEDLFEKVMGIVNGFMVDGDYDIMKKTKLHLVKALNNQEKSRNISLTVLKPTSFFIKWGEDADSHGPNTLQQMREWKDAGYFSQHQCYASKDNGKTWFNPNDLQ